MSTKLKYILYGLIALIAVVVVAIIYRMFFQFDAKEIEIYIREESEKYGTQKAAAFNIIRDGVEHILSSHNLTSMVLRSAKATGTDKEQELVNASINLCESLKYLKS